MTALDLTRYAACGLSLGLCVLISTSRRLQAATWPLASYLGLSALVAAAIAIAGISREWGIGPGIRAAYALTLVSAPLGLLVSLALRFGPPSSFPRRWRLGAAGMAVAGVALFGILALSGAAAGTLEGVDFVVRGSDAWYLSGLYLLSISVLALANLERTLRGVEDHVRWSVKFLIVGLATMFAANVYISSKVLMQSQVPYESIELFPVALLVACPLIFLTWWRSSGQVTIAVSHGLTYGTITFLAVGIYLLVASIASGWAAQILPAGAGGQTAVFLVLVVGLGILVLTTGVRQRARRWVRRHFFSGRYDYREFWLEAAARIRDSDPPDVAAEALSDLVQRALGTPEVTVWLRAEDGSTLRLAAYRGPRPEVGAEDLEEVLEAVGSGDAPLTAGRLAGLQGADRIGRFLHSARAQLAVPLRSGGQTLGLLAVGRDRSGIPLGWETAEFLRVLAGHFAAELHKAQLLEANLKAKETEAFRAFSTFLLHDLKNFASTLGLVAQNARKYEGDPEFQKDAFACVLETSQKMQRLIGSLRSFSSKLATNRKRADLNTVVSATAEELARATPHALELDLGDIPAVPIDRDEIDRLLQNLIVNASEAMEETGTIRVRTRAVDGWVELEVSDDGRGIPRAFLERDLFQPFRTTKSDGLGIGLFHCRKIAEAHGGRIDVESHEGRGTKVTVRLPVDETAEGREDARPARAGNDGVAEHDAFEE